MNRPCSENHNITRIALQEIPEIDNYVKPCPKCGKMISTTIKKSGMISIVAGTNAYVITIKEV